MKTTKTLKIADIRRDSGAQFRVGGLDKSHVSELVEVIKDGGTLPDIIVFFDGALYWLADGDHRIEAHLEAGLNEIEANVSKGPQIEARRFGRTANAKHGLKRDEQTKRAIVIDALTNDPEWKDYSNVRLAHACGVTEGFVRKVKKEIGFDTSYSTKYVHPKTGKVTTMKTAKIGSKTEESPKPKVHLSSTHTQPETQAFIDSEEVIKSANEDYEEEFADDDEFVNDSKEVEEPEANVIVKSGPPARQLTETEKQIEELPVLKALSMFGHRGHLFRVQANLWHTCHAAIKGVRAKGSHWRYTTGPITDALQAVAQLPDPIEWEGCAACKGSGRVGERADPCHMCKGGFTIHRNQGVSADVVKKAAEELIASHS
jgi:hypothetical protein